MKTIFYWIGGIIAFFVFIFILELFGLSMFKFFAPKKENIRREVYENTKSYTHGIAQDLGKYYQEYQSANEDERATIKSVIQMRFAEVDASKLQSIQLQSFLINMRGY